jgi:hypothetical protein
MIKEPPMISVLRTTKGVQSAVTRHVSLSRDIIRDWRRWNRAERAAAMFILAAVLAEMSLGVAAGLRSFV